MGLVFVDESGDPGLKLDEGSSKYFIVVLLIFNELSDAKRLDSKVHELREEFGFHSKFKFKFNSLHSDYRKKFFESISPFPFSYFGVVINKQELLNRGFRNKYSIYTH